MDKDPIVQESHCSTVTWNNHLWGTMDKSPIVLQSHAEVSTYGETMDRSSIVLQSHEVTIQGEQWMGIFGISK